MEKIKIHKQNRAIKKQSRKETTNWVVTPPARDYKHETSHKVNKLEKRLGYDYEDAEDSRIMVNLRN